MIGFYRFFFAYFLMVIRPILWFAKWILGDLLPAGGEYACL